MKKVMVIVLAIINVIFANYVLLGAICKPVEINLDAVREFNVLQSAPKAELLIDTTTDTLVAIGDCDVETYVAMADDMQWLMQSNRSEECSDVLLYVDDCPIRHIVKAVSDKHGGYIVVEVLR